MARNKVKIGEDLKVLVEKWKKENRIFESELNVTMSANYELSRHLSQDEKNWLLSQL